MKTESILLAGLLLAAPAPAQQEASAWLTDFEAAQAQAVDQGKDLLVDFTGSDWCLWCMRLEKEVFETDAFEDAIEQQFVLVKLDFPRDTSKLSEETAAQNERLKSIYPVPGFPTVYLLDAQGRPYAQTGYREGGGEVYMKHLAALRNYRERRDRAFAAAAAAEGVDRARHLDEGLEALEAVWRMPWYVEVVEEIVALDPDDTAGLRSKWSGALAGARVEVLLAELEGQAHELGAAKDWAGLETAMQTWQDAHSELAAIVQHALLYRAVARLESGKLYEGLKLLQSAREADRASTLVTRLEGMIAAVERELEKVEF